MITFLKSFFSFFIIVFVISWIIDISLSQVLKKSCKFIGEFEVWNDIYDGEIKSDIAIYGSSRAWVHFDPIIIENILGKTVYNYGIDGHNFWLQYLRHLEYLEYNNKPDYILLSVDIFSLDKRENLYNYEQFLPYMLWNKNMYNYTSSYEGFHELDYFLPLVRYYGKKSAQKVITNISEANNACTEPKRRKGYQAQKKLWSEDFETALEKKKFYESMVDNASLILFESFILECKKKDIKLILVYSPEYIDGQKYVQNRVDIIKIFEDFSKKYNLTYLDYSNDPMCNDKDYFYNASHLNEKGSILFSKKIGNDLKSVITY